MKRVLIPVALTATAVLLVTAAGSASSADPLLPAPTAASKRIPLILPAAKVTHLRAGGVPSTPPAGDPAPIAPAPGDSWLVSGALVHEWDDKVDVGSAVAQCVVIDADAPLQCSATLQLEEGQITLQGAAEPGGDETTLAITGGTGMYARWRGQTDVALLDPVAGTFAVTVLGR